MEVITDYIRLAPSVSPQFRPLLEAPCHSCGAPGATSLIPSRAHSIGTPGLGLKTLPVSMVSIPAQKHAVPSRRSWPDYPEDLRPCGVIGLRVQCAACGHDVDRYGVTMGLEGEDELREAIKIALGQDGLTMSYFEETPRSARERLVFLASVLIFGEEPRPGWRDSLIDDDE